MTPSSSRSYDLLWMSLALLVLLPIALFLSITPHDYWFYVRIGKDILESGAIPRVDTFSYTYPERPIFYQPWLSAVIFWLAHSAGGATLTYFLRYICIGSAYALVWALMRYLGTGAKLATLLLILLGFSSSMNWSMRPQMFAYPLFALMLWVLWHWQTGQPKLMWTLPLITLLWVNLHGSFVLAFVLMGSALIFGAGDRRKLVIWFVASLFATLINPRGVFVWEFVPDMLTSASDQQFATEWRPPVNAGWQMNIFFAWLLLFIPLAAFSPRRLSLLEWIWFLGFGWLALSGLRYVIWFMFIMAVLTGPLLTELWKSFRPVSEPQVTKPTFNYVLAGLILLLPLMMLPGIREVLVAGCARAVSPGDHPGRGSELARRSSGSTGTFVCRIYLWQLSDLCAALAPVMDRQSLQCLSARALEKISDYFLRRTHLGQAARCGQGQPADVVTEHTEETGPGRRGLQCLVRAVSG